MSEILTIEAHGSSYRIEDPGGIAGDLLREGRPYEWKVLEHIYSLGLEGGAIDVGAGFGNHSLWLAAICGLDVVAIEPLDIERLRDNLALNPGLPVVARSCALGDRNYEGLVHPAPEHVVGRRYDRHTLVQIERLDDAEAPDLALLKIDVEGMEPNVLRGARATIEREHPILYIEAESPAAGARNREALPPGYEHTATFGATPLEEFQWRG